jgi:hypothetical protein
VFHMPGSKTQDLKNEKSVRNYWVELSFSSSPPPAFPPLSPPPPPLPSSCLPDLFNPWILPKETSNVIYYSRV